MAESGQLALTAGRPGRGGRVFPGSVSPTARRTGRATLTASGSPPDSGRWRPPRPPVPRPPGSGPTGSPRSAEQPARKVDLTVNKVIAGAGAAATSAVLGSFFGALGTVAGAAIGAIASTMATSLYEHSLNRTQDTVAALRSRRRASAAATEATVPMPRIPPAGTAQDDQPTELLRPADPATTGPGSSDAPTAEVGSADGLTRRISAGGATSPEFSPGAAGSAPPPSSSCSVWWW